jgi:hypothetical protein
LDSFFPFDPYLLKRSKLFIESIYQEFNDVIDDEMDLDSDEETDEDDEEEDSFLNRSDEIKQTLDKLIGDISIFVKEKQEYLNQFKIDEEETKAFNKQSEVLQESLNKESIKLNSFIFNNEILEFWPYTNEIK